MAFFATLLVDGALAGAIYAPIALAFVVVYKASRLVNFALGEWTMVGALLVATGVSIGVGLAGGLVLAGAVMVGVALAFNRVVLRRVAGRSLIAFVMVTLGLGALMRGAAALLFAGVPSRLVLGAPTLSLAVYGVPIANEKLVAAAIAIAATAAVAWFFQRSRAGVALRAIADDQQIALSVGIDLDRYFAITWVMVAGLSVIAGVLWSAVSGGAFGVVLLGLKLFPIVIIGGLDSIPGALIGALVVGVLESLAAGYVDSVVGSGFSNVAPYLVLLAVLMVRPYGLFGEPDVERV